MSKDREFIIPISMEKKLNKRKDKMDKRIKKTETVKAKDRSRYERDFFNQ